MSATNSERVQSRYAALRVLASEPFLEKLFLLVATALLTGLLIPSAIKHLDATRQSSEAVSQAQSKLFADVSETLMTAETLILDVTWFGTQAAPNAELQKKAFDRYSEQIVPVITRWRVQISRAQTLASPALATKMHTFLGRFFIEQDTPMNQMWVKCQAGRRPAVDLRTSIPEAYFIRTGVLSQNECDWDRLHLTNEAMLAEATALIGELARDLGLTATKRG